MLCMTQGHWRFWNEQSTWEDQNTNFVLYEKVIF